MTNQQRVKALAIARANGGGHAPLRWVWPVNNCWPTKAAPRHASQPYSGPSARTKFKRVARGKRSKPAYL